jgi:hypothetical protein
MATSPALRLTAVWLAPAAACLLAAASFAAEAKKVDKNVKEIAGASEVLREVPKKFATLQAVDPGKGQVTLRIDGETQSRDWPLTPDAEIKVVGWWGRLEQFTAGDRVWAWFKTTRAGKPVAIFMLADEVSEQDIHGSGVKVVAIDKDKITIKPARGKNRVLKGDKTKAYGILVGGRSFVGGGKTRLLEIEPWSSGFKVGDKIFVQSAGDRARVILEPKALEVVRSEQKAALRENWLKKGLPGTVTFLHLSGEMDFMLDHEAMRWGRSLRPGDKASLLVSPPARAVVKHVQPWRERTQLRLVLKGIDLADLTLGQRIGLKMAAPPEKVDNDQLPPDLGRRTDKKERLDWFLASIYCTCGVSHDVCTGMFYTLSSCNPNACGMPNHMRKIIAAKIDKGLTDKQIFEELLKEYGADLVKPHLLP